MERRTSSYGLETVLNTAMGSRVGQMLPFKRMTDIYPRHARAGSTASDRTHGSMTPPPSYQEEEPVSPLSTPDSRPVSADGLRHLTRPPIVDDASGVRWQWAHQGYSSLLQAMPDVMPSNQDPRLTRLLYLNSLDYILQGLPEDLSPGEIAKLRRALPAPLRTQQCTASGQQAQLREDDDSKTAPSRPPTRLRRAVADILLCLTALVSTLVPYVHCLLHQAYRFDRRHNVTEKVVVAFILTADVVVRQMTDIVRRICAMHDGKVGAIIQLWCLWLADGIGGGVFDGFTEGFQKLGFAPDAQTHRVEAGKF